MCPPLLLLERHVVGYIPVSTKTNGHTSVAYVRYISVARTVLLSTTARSPIGYAKQKLLISSEVQSSNDSLRASTFCWGGAKDGQDGSREV